MRVADAGARGARVVLYCRGGGHTAWLLQTAAAGRVKYCTDGSCFDDTKPDKHTKCYPPITCTVHPPEFTAPATITDADSFLSPSSDVVGCAGCTRPLSLRPLRAGARVRADSRVHLTDSVVILTLALVTTAPHIRAVPLRSSRAS